MTQLIVLALLLLAHSVASAQPEQTATAFATIRSKLSTYGAMAFALAVVGTGVWVGIGMFKRGALTALGGDDPNDRDNYDEDSAIDVCPARGSEDIDVGRHAHVTCYENDCV